MQHEARLDTVTRDSKGKPTGTVREVYTALARKKRPANPVKQLQARERLKPRQYPRGLRYLLVWHYEARWGRRRDHQGQSVPLGWEGMTAWAEGMDHRLKPLELWALIRMERAELHPGGFERQKKRS